MILSTPPAELKFVFETPDAAILGMLDALDVSKRQQTERRHPIEVCPWSEARGRVLAEDELHDHPSPAFDYSAMDGYALHWRSLRAYCDAHPTTEELVVPVHHDAWIGCTPPTLCAEQIEAARIVTGAPLPASADIVLPRELVRECFGQDSSSAPTHIVIDRSTATQARRGAHIRRAGENAAKGEVAVPAGTLLTAASVAAVISAGAPAARVCKRLRVAIITTGDELVRPGEELGAFQVRNASAPALSALCIAKPWIELAEVTHARDDESDIVQKLTRAHASSDAIILTGGVSMGHRDAVSAAISSLGAEIVFHGLPQRPGKPMLGAVLRNSLGMRTPVFGLPGNPVATMATALRIVMPVLEQCAGACSHSIVPRIALAHDDGQRLGLWWYRLVELDSSGCARFIDSRGSGDTQSIGRSHGFVEIPPHETTRAAPPLSYAPFYAWPS